MDGGIDFLFILWGKPFSENDGAVNKQIRFIANSLSHRFKVGVLYVPYSIVAKKFKLYGDKNFFNKMKISAGYVYSKIRNPQNLNYSMNMFNKEINIYYNNFPNIPVKQIVTTYWWAVIMAKEHYDCPVYLIIYHDYSIDVQNSNKDNIKLLNDAYSLSNKISANPALNRKFNFNMPVIREGIELNKYRSGIAFKNKKKSILIPLRNGFSKGAIYGIKAIELIHVKFPEIVIDAFGYYTGHVPGFINFHYGIDDEELIKLYGSSMFFILPSIEEGISEPLLEAMINGCIPISTRCDGPETLIHENENGFLVPIKDPEAILNKFTDIKDMNLLEISNNAIKTAEQYDINREYQDLLKAMKYYENNGSKVQNA